MALIDLTNVDPWGKELEATKEANRVRRAALQDAVANLQRGLQASANRRAALEQQNMQFRDREYALIAGETNKLVQPQTGSKITDVKLQELGRQMKTEYYDAVKTYQASDKGDEARQIFETAKQKALTSARTVSGAIDKLDAQIELFRTAAGQNQISDATNPAIRDFMADLQDKNLDPNQYQIVPDEETGQLRYVGKTTNGFDVDFSLDDIANGDNGFNPVGKPDMPKVIQNLMKDVSNITKQEKNDWGVVEVTDWAAIGQQIDGRLDELLADTNSFKAIAAEEGFGYDALHALEAGEPWVDPEGNEWTSLDQVKDEVKSDIMKKIEAVTPHKEKQLTDNRVTLVDREQRAQAVEKQQGITAGVVKAAGQEDLEFFKQSLLGRVKGVDNITIKDGKLIMGSGFGSKFKPSQVYDLKNQGDLARLTELFGGNRDLATIESDIINF